MALTRFPREKYASLELNQVAFPKTGMVISQTPLSEDFTAAAPCENGMWVSADKGNGVIKPLAAATETPVGIVYTAEKEYDDYAIGLKNFGRKVAGDYPRVGILGVGDTVTTNCLQYDAGQGAAFADFDALDTYLSGDLSGTNKAYVVVPSGQNDVKCIPQIVKSLPNGYTGAYGRITKYYTVPNGEKGVKYEMLRV